MVDSSRLPRKAKGSLNGRCPLVIGARNRVPKTFKFSDDLKVTGIISQYAWACFDTDPDHVRESDRTVKRVTAIHKIENGSNPKVAAALCLSFTVLSC